MLACCSAKLRPRVMLCGRAVLRQKAFASFAAERSSAGRGPRLHVYGHIHGGFGVQFHKSGACSINAAVVDNDFCLVHPIVVVDVPVTP